MTRNDAPMLMLMLLLSQLAIVDLYHYPVENEMKILEQPQAIPDICHEPHEHVRVNFFWPV